MKSGDDVLAVIVGRAGSKGLPGKNSLPVAGRPMVAHTIEDARQARCVRRVVVSTDCPAVAEAAADRDVEVVWRPAELATDTATVDSAARHAVRTLGAGEPIVVILYANVPVRPDDLIDRAVRELLASGADSVQSYSPVGKCHPHWMMTIDDDGRVRPFIESRAYRRQDLPELLIPDGGVIAVRRGCLLDAGDEGPPHAFLGRDRRGVVCPHGAVIDVDEPFDALVAEAALSRAVAAV